MISTSAELGGVYGYIGAVGGIIEAIEDPRFEGDFSDWVMSDLKSKFRTDAIAINESGAGGISHVFEWGGQDAEGVATGDASSIPLFRVTKKAGPSGGGIMSYYFVPSVKPVPLPDPDKYGFKHSKLQHLRRHVFRYKAIVMETQAAVTIAPTNAKALFIPLASADRGYIMTKKAVTINPGGAEASGGFAQFWGQWFASVAPGHVKNRTKLAGELIQKTGQRVIRNAAGQFSRGQKVGIAYINAAERAAELEMLTAAKNYFADGLEGDE